MKVFRQFVGVAVAGAVMMVASARPAAGQWQVESKDGKSSLKVGFLAQPQMEVVDTPDGTDQSKNVFLRRIRIIFGGKISDRWTFFFETDSPNLGKATGDKVTNPTGTKDSGGMYIQDAYFTYSQGDVFKVDVGMIMVPLGHNHNQSATSLLPVDYGCYSFLEVAPTGTRVGRDYGVQLRGYPAKQHFEYRLGVFEGARGSEARNAFRVAGRAVWYPFAADTGFFYGGTFHATRRVWAIGAGFDTQEEYHTYAADMFVEQPFNKGQHGLTAQVNWMRLDGGTFLTTLPKQQTVEVEAGFHFVKAKITPLVQYARRMFDNAATPEQSNWQAGVAYWMAGHQRNIKVTAGRLHTDGQPDRTQVLVQLQLFYF
jgi:hypothetical protein